MFVLVVGMCDVVDGRPKRLLHFAPEAAIAKHFRTIDNLDYRRVLKPQGWAVFMVLVTVETTVEDPSITDPAERERLFGQRDLVRRYGRDFTMRLEDAGFSVASYLPKDVDGARAPQYAIPERVSPIFFCRKQSP